MMVRSRTRYEVHFFGEGLGVPIHTFLSRVSLQFYMRYHYGAGIWRQTGNLLEVRQSYSGLWRAVGYIRAIDTQAYAQ